MKRSSFNDNWQFGGRTVTLPHDAMLEAGRAAENPSGSAGAYFAGGVYRYRKAFTAPADWQGKAVRLQFEGVYQNAKVTLNGQNVGGAAYGYIPFWADLGAALRFDAENVLEVMADNADQPNSRWYTGGGIYRPVWLWVGEPDGITPENIRVTTVSTVPPCVRVDCEADVTKIEILDGDALLTAADKPGEILLPDAQLWSAETPKLYRCRVTLANGDSAETSFGVRQLKWDTTGFYVNGKNTLLRGGCLHHDHGILGAACHAESEWRRVQMLKNDGFNAIRCAHNPASPALLDACDALGMYVMDEMWDMWYNHKTHYDYALHWDDCHADDLRAVVRRDYNHPCVALYSVGNENSEPAKEKGVAALRKMVALLHEIDSTRPVTAGLNLSIIASASRGKGVYDDENGGRKEDDNENENKMQGMNSTIFNFITNIVGTGMNKAANSGFVDRTSSPAADAVDIAGYNYASGRYPLEGKKHPNRIVVGSETFPQDIAKNWEMVEKYPYLIGDFMWTAWDYLGETGIGAWAYTPDGKGFAKPYPWLLADCGAFDLLGRPTAEAMLAMAVWTHPAKPLIAVQPVNHPGVRPAKAVWRGSNGLASWAWQGCDGSKTTVEVYSAAAQVELILNGRSCGKKRPKLCKASFAVQYAPGTLEAVAYDAAVCETGRSKLVSCTGPVHIALTKCGTVPNGAELCYLDIALADANGTTESNADRLLHITVENGELLGFGSANPCTEEGYQTGQFTSYYGCAQAVVRPGAGCVVRVSADGLPDAEIKL